MSYLLQTRSQTTRKSGNKVKINREDTLSTSSESTDLIMSKMPAGDKTLANSVSMLNNVMTITKCKNTRPSTSHSPSRQRQLQKRSSSASGMSRQEHDSILQHSSGIPSNILYKGSCWTNQAKQIKLCKDGLLPNRFSLNSQNPEQSKNIPNKKIGKSENSNKNHKIPNVIWTGKNNLMDNTMNSVQNFVYKGESKGNVNGLIYLSNNRTSEDFGDIKNKTNNVKKYCRIEKGEQPEGITRLPLISIDAETEINQVSNFDNSHYGINTRDKQRNELLVEQNQDEAIVLETKNIFDDDVDGDSSINASGNRTSLMVIDTTPSPDTYRVSALGEGLEKVSEENSSPNSARSCCTVDLIQDIEVKVNNLKNRLQGRNDSNTLTMLENLQGQLQGILPNQHSTVEAISLNTSRLKLNSSTASSSSILGCSQDILKQHIVCKETRMQREKHRKHVRQLERDLHYLKLQDPLRKYELAVKDVQFERSDLLGEGAFSRVYKGIYNGSEVAIKCLKWPLSVEDNNYFKIEANLLLEVRHPRIVMLLGICLAGRSPFMVLEYLPGGNLYSRLHDKSRSELKPEEFFRITTDVALGMSYLHCHKPPILHLDLKTTNVLLDNQCQAKVADFGFSKLRCDADMLLNKGPSIHATPVWMAPELVDRGEMSSKSDVYSFAIILWEMVTRQIPFIGYSVFQVIEAIKQRQRPRIPDTCHKSLQLLIVNCWQQSSRLRPSFKEILACLQTLQSCDEITTINVTDPSRDCDRSEKHPLVNNSDNIEAFGDQAGANEIDKNSLDSLHNSNAKAVCTIKVPNNSPLPKEARHGIFSHYRIRKTSSGYDIEEVNHTPVELPVWRPSIQDSDLQLQKQKLRHVNPWQTMSSDKLPKLPDENQKSLDSIIKKAVQDRRPVLAESVHSDETWITDESS